MRRHIWEPPPVCTSWWRWIHQNTRHFWPPCPVCSVNLAKSAHYVCICDVRVMKAWIIKSFLASTPWAVPYHKSFHGPVVDAVVWFKDVKVECRSEKSSMTSPFMTLGGEQTIPKPSHQEHISSENGGLWFWNNTKTQNTECSSKEYWINCPDCSKSYADNAKEMCILLITW